METTFQHQQHAHCESGVTANLLSHYGIQISEPMAFGIGAGIFFGHFPFIKVSGIPGTTFRIWPGYIFKRVTQRLGVSIQRQSFKSPEKGMQMLDEVLATGTPVGLLSGIYYLDYMPEAFRFHFNAHNLVVTGKEGSEYLVSDPILEAPARIGAAQLKLARFAKGFPEPKGKMYFIKTVPAELDFKRAIQSGIRQTCFFMLSPPLPWAGTNAIFTLARKVSAYPDKLSDRKRNLYLGNIIRMQEEIGTGGAGFRFLYAAFLQEAATLLDRPDLKEMAARMTAIGDQWRAFAFQAAQVFKARKAEVSYPQLSELLVTIGEQEKAFFKDLKRVNAK